MTSRAGEIRDGCTGESAVIARDWLHPYVHGSILLMHFLRNEFRAEIGSEHYFIFTSICLYKNIFYCKYNISHKMTKSNMTLRSTIFN